MDLQIYFFYNFYDLLNEILERVVKFQQRDIIVNIVAAQESCYATYVFSFRAPVHVQFFTYEKNRTNLKKGGRRNSVTRFNAFLRSSRVTQPSSFSWKIRSAEQEIRS